MKYIICKNHRYRHEKGHQCGSRNESMTYRRWGPVSNLEELQSDPFTIRVRHFSLGNFFIDAVVIFSVTEKNFPAKENFLFCF